MGVLDVTRPVMVKSLQDLTIEAGPVLSSSKLGLDWHNPANDFLAIQGSSEPEYQAQCR